MKIEYKVIAGSIAFGLAVWVIDAALDYFFFYEGTFWGLIITDIPKHEVYIRSVILAFFAIFGILMSNTIGKLKRTRDNLRSSNQQLVASEQQLKATNQQLIASEQQLKATNQQLVADEQQLKAANQQLVASEQQLKAANQQLVADEQQLKAANQQLVASDQQLRATNQQLVASDQQLRATNQELVAGERKLRQQSKFLMNVIDSLDHPFYVIDANDYTITLANSAAMGANRLTDDTTCYQLTHGLDGPCNSTGLHKCPAEQVKSTKQPAVVEHTHSTNGDDERVFEYHAHPILNEAGEVFQIIEYSLDITQRKRAEQDREWVLKELTAKTKELESIVYVASHDLRSPLVNIQGFSQELRDNCDLIRSAFEKEELKSLLDKELLAVLDVDIPEAVRFITASTRMMDSLLSGLLRLSRLSRVELNIRKLDMNALMSDIVGSMSYQIKIVEAKVQVDPLESCLGDESQIGQIFTNILDNALKYLDNSRPGMIHVSCSEKDDCCVYCVEDNGIGIDLEHQSKIFEIFHRLDPGLTEGEGLGLTTARRILDRHDGSIWVESEPGKASKFFVSVPKA